MVKQVEDGKINTFERVSNVWMKVTRGDIASRFGEIKKTYLEVASDSRRDERLRELQYAEDRYQVAKDISDNLTVSYNTSEVIMARLMQTTSAKDRVYKQAITFFGTNETVLTAMSASFTGLFGLHESTQSLEAMKDGVSKSLEDLAEIGGKVQEAAVRAGYGPTIRAESVKRLVESVVNFQLRTADIIDEMRVLSTKNAEEIRDSVEDGKKRLATIINRGNSLALPHKIWSARFLLLIFD